MALRIAVFIKQVPATDDIKVDKERGTLIREGIPLALNPCDAHALEAALCLKDELGAEVVAATMGPPQASEVLSQAISMGVDDIFLLSDRIFAGSDTWSTALVLRAFVQAKGPFDLIVCGDHSTDGETGQVGPQIAEFLDIPSATHVVKLGPVTDSAATLTRRSENSDVTVEVPLPVLVTVGKDINEPRIPSLSGMMRARSAQATVLDAAALGITPEMVGIDGSPTKVVRLVQREHSGTGEMLEGSIDEQVNSLIDSLEAKGLI